MAAWVEGRVIERIEWTPTLFSLRVAAELAPYEAGQFTKLALEQGERRIQRAYSFVNPPSSPYHEFYFVEIPSGELTPSLGSLQVGDNLLVQSQATGFLTLDEVPAGRDLWLLSTGTAIGPFLSMLADGEAFSRFESLVLVHGVRKGEELSYQPLIASFGERYGARFRYVPFVSREEWSGAMAGRIPTAISDGQLQARVGLDFSPEFSQVLICGNPAMVKETQQTLLGLGLAKNLRRAPGNISAENYW
ncbi:MULTISPECIES: ferredoxin--NADP reductase [Aeromonas]|uniref:ferredoxin--NADP reductase n=1 Tax=Aeromonas TaxID=642 RepID=UPI0005A6EFA9|nr:MULTISPECIES: ferredoxin--NADP reductase [Aeromonas]MBL0522051.1 ferredoxin--NADP reductase [Aeromonas enteropelogenes]QXC35530.1 ferredoxin--NADP reductase [Aeromonas sp. FDAARGOS 1407]UBH52897.1 ferredoxin--NADP reductase [Aeromonas enteropelogenes]UBH55628.1 ferredoxin--NADP reductase [Aeromonas enteropelogenes]